MSITPITGEPDDVIDEVENTARLVCLGWGKDLKKFHIGRTHDLDERLNSLSSDCIEPLYKTTSTENAKKLETSLLERFSNDPQMDSAVDDSRGNIVEGEDQYVYIAVWSNFKDRAY